MKNQIFELFGHAIDDISEKADFHRRNCICPFYNRLCDGGGNRYQTFLSSKKVKELGLDTYFQRELANYPPGVCSLKVKDKNWIVCPRRLFSFSEGQEDNYHTSLVKKIVKKYCKLEKGRPIGIWPEVKIKYKEQDGEFVKSFDYTFDYIVASVSPRPIDEIASELSISSKSLKAKIEKLNLVLSYRNEKLCIENYPTGKLNIIEVMTSSTSGGNKNKGTTIQQSFINAIKNENHVSPGINYRQVWARMVSQLIVKSQISNHWNSNTLWILQDSLTDYISLSTDLNLTKLISKVPKGVNLVSVKYSNQYDRNGCLKLMEDHLYSGEIPTVRGDTDFNKLLQASIIPQENFVKNKIVLKKPICII